MTTEQKTTQEEPRVPYKGMLFAAMLEKMMGRQGSGCDCTEIMSQMMAMCGGAQHEKEEETAPEATQKA